MSTLTKDQENYIEHEVQLRLNDEKFAINRLHFDKLDGKIDRLETKMDASIKHLDNKLLVGFGIFISISVIGWIIPICLKFIKV
jgi:hypothetical protein